MSERITILGSTGSIGTQCADVALKTGTSVDLICFGNNVKEAEKQIRTLNPRCCVAADERVESELKAAVGDTDTKIYSGRKTALELIGEYASDVIYNAVSGQNGLDFTVAAVKTGKRVGLANKESMVTAGNIVNALAKEHGTEIIPVDSEHSAIFQCLKASATPPKRILLTASGGPFYGLTKDEVAKKTAKEALKHPNWDMGKKILVDSATLANKGLELIEAMRLFGVPYDAIKIIVQRQSIIHSMVQFSDNAVLAQLGVPDMRLCIEYALFYPERGISVCDELDWDKIENISIGKPDYEVFPMLALAKDCAKKDGAATVVYNASNEVAVAYYLEDKIGFYDIYEICAECAALLSALPAATLEDIAECDRITRKKATELAEKYRLSHN